MDRVKVERVVQGRRRDGSKSTEGQITDVVEPYFQQLPGLLVWEQERWQVIPDHPMIPQVFNVRGFGEGMQPEADLKVLLEPDRRSKENDWSGRVVEILGKAGDSGVDMISLLHERRIEVDFEDDVREAAQLDQLMTEGLEDPDRLDLRENPCFTIDPADAKDHDDAISVEKQKDGSLRIGIHIADVSHYVQPDSPVDREALQRGTSVYLVDRTIPMLPHNLTEDLCSLVPDQDRLAFSAILDLDPDTAAIRDYTLSPSIIRSRARLHYEQVQDFIDGKEHSLPKEAEEAVTALNRIARKLRAQRIEAGSINFNMPEIRCELNAEGHPIRLVKRESGEAYELIEEMMLLANQTVARRLDEADRPTIYRVHPEPEPDDFIQMGEDLRQVGIQASPNSSQDMNDLVSKYGDRPNRHGMYLAMLRNLKQAYYHPDRNDHFGLSFTHYVHFTSPIRRYPDLVVHRTLRALLNKESSPYNKDSLGPISAHCSAQERNASEAEQESMTIKRLQYYEESLDQGKNGPFEGVITRVKSAGMVVELTESLQSGWLGYAEYGQTHIQANPDQGTAHGVGTDLTLTVGDLINVGISSVDHQKREVSFFPWEGAKQTSGSRSTSGKQGSSSGGKRNHRQSGKRKRKGAPASSRKPKPASKRRKRK